MIEAVNYYSVIHFIIWFLAAKYLKINWTVFLVLSFCWELIELLLPFNFAVETVINKIFDIIINIIGYSLGLKLKRSINEK